MNLLKVCPFREGCGNESRRIRDADNGVAEMRLEEQRNSGVSDARVGGIGESTACPKCERVEVNGNVVVLRQIQDGDGKEKRSMKGGSVLTRASPVGSRPKERLALTFGWV